MNPAIHNLLFSKVTPTLTAEDARNLILDNIKENLVEHLSVYTESALVSLWNTFVSESGSSESKIFDNDSDGYSECFNEDVAECSRAMLYGEVNNAHSYFYLNNCLNVATGFFDDMPFDSSVLADWLLECDNNMNNLSGSDVSDFYPATDEIHSLTYALIVLWNSQAEPNEVIHLNTAEEIQKIVDAYKGKELDMDFLNDKEGKPCNFFTFDHDILTFWGFDELQDDDSLYSPFDYDMLQLD